MEILNFQYFAVVKTLLAVLLVYLALVNAANFVVRKPVSKPQVVLIVVILLTMLVVKVNFTDTNTVTRSANAIVEQGKTLPPKVEDTTFKNNVAKDITINPETIKP